MVVLHMTSFWMPAWDEATNAHYRSSQRVSLVYQPPQQAGLQRPGLPHIETDHSSARHAGHTAPAAIQQYQEVLSQMTRRSSCVQLDHPQLPLRHRGRVRYSNTPSTSGPRPLIKRKVRRPEERLSTTCWISTISDRGRRSGGAGPGVTAKESH